MKSIATLAKTVFRAIGLTLIQTQALAMTMEECAEGLSGLDHEETLQWIDENEASWPMLQNLADIEADLRDKAKQMTTQVLEALKHEANSLGDASSRESVVNRTTRAMRIAKMTKEAGGHLNDLISVSSEKVAIIGAWIALDRWPESSQEIRNTVFRDSQKDPLRAKRWFAERWKIDDWLSLRADRLDEIEDDTPGFQAGNHLGSGRSYANNHNPTVFDLIETADLNVLWWQVFYNDYELSATIPAASDFVARGGRLSPVPNHKAKAVADIFGENGIPYEHELRSGKLHADDIWTSFELSVKEASRFVNIQNWFGD